MGEAEGVVCVKYERRNESEKGLKKDKSKEESKAKTDEKDMK